ncbi:MAG: cytochrome c oxidase subunit 3 [Planctomycetota bacterium]
MTTISADTAEPHDDHGDHHDHPAHLAHHFDTPVQQYASGKLGMWVFLGTEVLMFGGLFVAYFVYRANNPLVFQYAAQELNVTLGFINTLILISSSMTMALAVRAIQLGDKKATTFLLVLTLLGGFGFLGVKSVEYYQKISKGYFVGKYNLYSAQYEGGALDAKADTPSSADVLAGEPDLADTPDNEHAEDDKSPEATAWGVDYADPHAGTGDAVVIRPDLDSKGTVTRIRDGDARAYGNHNAADPKFVDEDVESTVIIARDDDGHHKDHHGDDHDAHAGGHHIKFSDLSRFDQERVGSFYSVYFAMTGLHVVHVIIGMALIGWVAVKAHIGTFSTAYFTPVDIVGLYWHLVDLIWIFLFPLLYLIH